MTRQKRIKETWLLVTRLFCLGAAVLVMSARPGACQLNVFFPDTISTDTVIIVSADSFVTGKDTGLSAVKVGWTPGPVAQSHRIHEKMGLSCVTCHHKHNNDARIKQCTQCHKGIAGMENLHNKCGQCHLYRARDMSCSSCHKTPEKGAIQADLFKFKFSHVKHYALKKDCRFCHAEPLRAQWLKKDNYPAMKTCLSCHDNRKSSGQCSVCHNDVAQIKPKSHTYLWVGRNGHGLEADYNKAECLQCHSKNECDRCHLGQTSCRIHPPGYRLMHGIDVRMGVTNCAMCHEAKNSCSQCHENRLR
jgi:hypothetical protein